MAGKVIEEPDIHLILEYSSGAGWGTFTSRRANRYLKIKTFVLERMEGIIIIIQSNEKYFHFSNM